MMNLINKKKAEEGFTLIELMIVVAIIGILAAIALPQFAAYRMRAFNSTAEADGRNLRISVESAFADFNDYTSTQTAAGTNATAGVALNQATPGGLSSSVTDATEFLPLTWSNNVTGSVSASGATGTSITFNAGATGFTSSIGAVKHFSGDKFVAFDSDNEVLYWRVVDTRADSIYTTVDLPAAPTTADDFAGLAGWKTIAR